MSRKEEVLNSEADQRRVNWRNVRVRYYMDYSGRRDILLTRKAYSDLKREAKERGADVHQYIRQMTSVVNMAGRNGLRNASIVLCRKKRVLKPATFWKRIKTIEVGRLSAA